MKNTSYKIALVAGLAFAGLNANAQVYNTVGTGNKLVINSKESRAGLVGEPYLYPTYKVAYIKFANATTTPYEIKYDQLSDEVVVKGDGDSELSFSEPVIEFRFKDEKRHFRNGFEANGKSTEKSYYEVIHDGKVKYLKRSAKVIIEAKEYNSATVTKKIEADDSYYIAKGDSKQLTPVKNNEKSILAALDKQEELKKYIKDNKLNLKNDQDVAKLFAYYESISGSAS